jgi:hypothetical protein
MEVNTMGINNKTNTDSVAVNYLQYLTAGSDNDKLHAMEIMLSSLVWAADHLASGKDKYCPAALTQGQWGHPLKGDCVNNCAVNQPFARQCIECWVLYLIDMGDKIHKDTVEKMEREAGGDDGKI